VAGRLHRAGRDAARHLLERCRPSLLASRSVVAPPSRLNLINAAHEHSIGGDLTAVLPDIGQEVGSSDPGRAPSRLVPAYDDLIAHLVRSTPLDAGEAARVVDEVVGYFSEQLPEFVRRRHAELKRRGLTNEQIFAALGAELAARRVAPPPLSERQLRRIVYG
jgi:hypothetical protein